MDGLLCVTPYYNKATQGGLIRYYTEIANSVKLPIIMYNVPSRTGCNILPETAAKLYHDVENIVAIKEATGNVAQAAKTMYLTDGKLDLYPARRNRSTVNVDRSNRCDLRMVKRGTEGCT